MPGGTPFLGKQAVRDGGSSRDDWTRCPPVKLLRGNEHERFFIRVCLQHSDKRFLARWQHADLVRSGWC